LWQILKFQVDVEASAARLSEPPCAAVRNSEQTAHLKKNMRLVALAWCAAAASALSPRSVEHPSLRSLAVGEEMVAAPCIVRRLAKSPSTFLLRGVLGAEDCRSVAAAATAKGLEAARTAFDGEPGSSSARLKSEVAWLTPPAALTSAVAGLLLSDEARDAPGSGCEDLQVVRYSAGGSYSMHHDATRDAPRAVTVLYYLNGVGNTWLPLADDARARPASRPEALARAAAADPDADGVRVGDPAAGDALVFFNFDEDTGGLDWSAIHTALPAESEKWVGNHWFHVGGVLASPDG